MIEKNNTESTKKNFIGYFMVLFKNIWFNVLYLNMNSVKKICSFIGYNYGTIIGELHDFPIYKKFVLDTIMCSTNAENFENCEILTIKK